MQLYPIQCVWEATGMMLRAVKEHGFSDETVLDAFFSSPDLSGRLLSGGYGDSDMDALIAACADAPDGRSLHSPGSFSVLMTDLIAEVSCNHRLDPSEVYRSCRGSDLYRALGDRAAVLLHDDDGDGYRRMEELILSLHACHGGNDAPSDSMIVDMQRSTRGAGIQPLLDRIPRAGRVDPDGRTVLPAEYDNPRDDYYSRFLRCCPNDGIPSFRSLAPA